MNKLIIFVSVLFASLAYHSLAAAPVLSEITPPFGEPGSSVRIDGYNFDGSATYTVTIDGIAAAVTATDDDGINITIPSGARSGIIEVSDGEESVEHPIPFVVLRTVSGTFTAPDGVETTNLLVATGDSVEELPANGEFTTTVTEGQPTAVWVFEEENTSAFIGIIPSDKTTVIIDIESTAVALIALNPFVGGLDDTRLADIEDFLSTHPARAVLVERITAAAEAGTDYLDDGQVLTAVEEALSELEFPSFSPSAITLSTDPGIPNFWWSEVNPPAGPLSRFTPKVTLDSSSGDIVMEYFLNENSPNSLDWTMELFRLNPNNFENGISSIKALDGSSELVPFNPIPVSGGSKTATLGTSKIDLFGWLFSTVQNFILGPVDSRLKTNEFRFNPALDQGVYVLNAYSGNVPNGLNLQSAVLEKGDPNSQWEMSLASNAMVAVIDAASVAISFKTVLSSEDIQNAVKDVFSWAKNIRAYRSTNSFNVATFYDYAKSVISAKIKSYLTARLAFSADNSNVARFSGKALRFMSKSIDILGKISSGAQAVERTAVLLTEGTFALERTVIVVGDVFEPFLDRIENQFPDESESIKLVGGNFPADTSGLTITFCTFHSSSGGVANSQTATINSSGNTSNTLSIKIADLADFRTKFTQSDGTVAAYICIEEGDTKKNSLHLGEVNGRVFLPPLPTVTSIEPAKVYPKSVITLHGTGFDSKSKVFVNGTQAMHTLLDDKRMLVFLPNLSAAASNQLKVTRETLTSADYSLEILDPSLDPTGIASGVSITITKLDMSNTADGEISLLEAFLIASGGLGRPIETHSACENISQGQPGYCGGFQQRETDFVFGDDFNGIGGGAGFRDDIRLDADLAGLSCNVDQSLNIGAGDDIVLRGITLDGGGGDFDALVYDGVVESEIRDVIIQNFGKTGMVFKDGAKNNEIDDVTIQACGGSGITIEAQSTHNQFDTVELLSLGGTALSVSGQSNFNSFSNFQIDDAAGNGVTVSDGSEQCTFTDFSITNIGESGANVFGFQLSDSPSNLLDAVEISMVEGTGLHLTGSATRYNRIFHPVSNTSLYPYELSGAIRDISGTGLLLDNEAQRNIVGLKFVSNSNVGIRLTGLNTSDNVIGHQYNRDVSSNSFFETLIFQIVADNDGRGIEVLSGANQNVLTGLNIAGNGGDGILLQNVERSRVLSIYSGFQDFIQDEDPFAHPNSGHSIHLDNADYTTIGSAIELFIPSFGGPSSGEFQNQLHHDTGDGIFLENESDNNDIRGTAIGIEAHDSYKGPIGANGIHIAAGCSQNFVGDSLNDSNRVRIDASPGAGILIEGNGADENLISGIDIGSGFSGLDPSLLSGIGIHLRNGAKGNRIGRGDRNLVGFWGDLGHINEITNCSDAGLVIDNAGGSIPNTQGRLEDPNLIENNSIFNCDTGIRITGNAKGNIIGGTRAGPRRFGNFVQIQDVRTEQNNSISGSSKAALHILDNVIPSPALRNQIMFNSFSNGSSIPDPAPNFSIGPPDSVGLLVSGTSTGNIIGEDLYYPNRFSSVVGAYIDDCDKITLRGNAFDGYGNVLVGIYARNGENNVIGGHHPTHGNTMESIGSINNAVSAGIIIDRGNNNSIQGNVIKKINGDGIRILDSTSNLIGGPNLMRGNQIFQNTGRGIHIMNAASTLNVVQSNFIGTNVTGNSTIDGEPSGNESDGILIQGATSNFIGGDAVLAGTGSTLTTIAGALPGTAPNTIAFNDANGVHVSVSGIQNQILDNSIHTNGELGILLASGGNGEFPAPANGSYDAGTAAGNFNNAVVPENSLVQLFSDSDLEGQLYLGETRTRADGSWSITGLPFTALPKVTATITNANDNNTSQFGTLSFTQSFTLTRRLNDSPSTQEVPFGYGKEVETIPLKLASTGADVVIKGLSFTASGTFEDSTGLASINVWNDLDENGVLSESDQLIYEGGAYDMDDGTFALSFEDGETIPAGLATYWILTYISNGMAQVDQTFSLELDTVEAVNAEYRYPAGLSATPSNTFPVASDVFTINDVPADPFNTWTASKFEDPTSDDAHPLADPDRDGISNLLEWLLGGEPLVANVSLQPQIEITNDGFEYEANFLNVENGATIELQVSENMRSWFNNLSAYGIYEEIDNGDGTITVRFKIPATPTKDTLFIRLNAER